LRKIKLQDDRTSGKIQKDKEDVKLQEGMRMASYQAQ
jgi:hypothetical protein